MFRHLLLVLLVSFTLGWIVLRYNPNPTFIEGVVGQPVDLVPGQGPDNNVDKTLEYLLFRSLFAYDENGRIIPDLAETFSRSHDDAVYTLKLKDAYWHDGEAITATDVAFTFTQDPAFSDVTVEQKGERQIRFILENPLASFLDILTKPLAPAHFRSISTLKLGSSEFSIQKIVKEGGRISEIYFKNGGDGEIKTLIFRFFPTQEELIKAAHRGEVDGFSSSDLAFESFEKFETPLFGQYFALFFNLESTNNLVNSASFRKAAAGKTPLVMGKEVKGPMSGTWAQANLNFPSFNKRRTKRFSGEITITVPTSANLEQASEEIKRSWEKSLGVGVNIRKVDPQELGGILENQDFEALVLGQTVGRDPDRYNLWHSSQKEFPGQNISGYADPRADRALEEGRASFLRDERKTHYTNFQRLFVDDSPAIFLYHPKFTYWVSREFTNTKIGELFYSWERFRGFQDWVVKF